jgi:uncharacterized protein YecE (DUF72 family)
MLVGTSGWKHPHWRGQFYPTGLVQRRELEFLSERLDSVEVNATFHADQSPATFARWNAETAAGFRFSLKGSKAVAHQRRLRLAQRDVASFFGSGVLELGEKLGAVFWQFPPELEYQRDLVGRFLATLPHTADGRRIRNAVEARHPSFANPEFVELLRDNDVAAVFSNNPAVAPIQALTSDFVYVRLFADADHYPDGYGEAALDHWAALIRGWATERDVFVYFQNPDHDSVHPPHDAVRLRAKLEG